MDAVNARLERWPKVRRHVLEWAKSLAIAAVLAILLRTLVVQGFYIPSGSMEPTLEPGDSVLVNRFVYRLHPPRRGDIMVFRFPADERLDFVKRVIGVPGDVVEERDGHFLVNGLPLRQPGVVRVSNGGGPGPTLDFGRVPRGQFFVLGDNRDASLDSRYWGTVNMHEVIGQAFLVHWSRGAHWWDVRWGRIARWIR